MVGAVRLDCAKGVKSIIVACCAVGKVKGGARIVETVGIDDVVVDGHSSLVKMSMSVDIHIYTVLVEEILKGGLDSWVGGGREIPA